jgi:hypothetical protein
VARRRGEAQRLLWARSAERLAHVCKLTTFEADGPAVSVRHHRLLAQAPASVDLGGLHNHLQLGQAQPYTHGQTLASAIARTWLNTPWALADLARALQPYVAVVNGLAGLPAHSAFDPHREVPGRCLDAIAQNIVLDAQGQPQLIDEEWVSDSPLTLGFLLFRTLQALALNAQRVAPCADRAVHSPADLIQAAFQALGHELSESALRSCVQQEAQLQTQISGVAPNTQEHWAFLNTHRFAPRLLSEHAQQLQQQVVSQDIIITDRENTIRIITGSRWWRLGAPVRWVMRRLKTP